MNIEREIVRFVHNHLIEIIHQGCEISLELFQDWQLNKRNNKKETDEEVLKRVLKQLDKEEKNHVNI